MTTPRTPSCIQGISCGPPVWALSNLKGSELWASIGKVVYDGFMMALQGFRIRTHTRGPRDLLGSIGRRVLQIGEALMLCFWVALNQWYTFAVAGSGFLRKRVPL